MNNRPKPLNPVVRSVFSFPAFLYGLLIAGVGFGIYTLGVLIGFLRIFLDPFGHWIGVIDRSIWYSGIPVVAGLILMLFDLIVLLPKKRKRKEIRWNPPQNTNITLSLTAYNDEASIASAVEDFRSHPIVKRVIVVDNNSQDRTAESQDKQGL